jgi:5S rRNA maturation endonuclease (ribonuclease M5)
MQKKEEFEGFIERLRKASEEKIVLVEGAKDKNALESLGVKNIMTLKKPLYAVVEDIVSSGKDCVILTDLDKKGKEIYARVSSKLKQSGVKVDNRFREFLFETRLRQIEGIISYLGKLT